MSARRADRAVFLLFEMWFLVPLPKGPIERLLGLLSRERAASAHGIAEAQRRVLVEDISNLMQGFAVALTWKNLIFMLVGILLGVLIGVLPGLGGANGVAILLPLTFSIPPTSAIIMLSCIYWGALFGGAITSVLSTFQVSHGRWPQSSTAFRWRKKAARAKR